MCADQPVRWLEWGSEAFERAQRERKPILLDIGASWCHWCHVLDREAYENTEIARIIHENFIPVKVDRDERPDVDVRYQKAVQAMTGMGGWPLTVFLTPEGKAFFGGTYFPPEDAPGRPSFRRVLLSVASFWRDHSKEALEQAERLEEILRPPPRERRDLTEDLFEPFWKEALEEVDGVWGGWGRGPKFPPFVTLLLLMRILGRVAPSHPPLAKRIEDGVRTTLDSMSRGGVFDHVGGGFHRYSVDREWRVPHFEKLLSDNALAIVTYSNAYALFRNEEDLRVARRSARFLLETLLHPEGGFSSSQNADLSSEDDGSAFTWTRKEVEEVLEGEARRIFLLAFGDSLDGGGVGGRSVLRMGATPKEVARVVRKNETEVLRLLDGALDRLLIQRRKRGEPSIDTTRYTSSNAWASWSLLELWGVTGEEIYRREALRTLDVFLERAYNPETGFVRGIFSDGTASGRGLLEDQSSMMLALTMAYSATGREIYLERAREVLGVLEEYRERGVFWDVCRGSDVPRTEVPLFDSPGPSAFGVALWGLSVLLALLEDPTPRRVLFEALEETAGVAPKLGIHSSGWLLGLDLALHPPPSILIEGSLQEKEDFRRAAWRTFHPFRAIRESRGGKGLPSLETPFAIVCLGERCAHPVRGPKELSHLLSTFR